MSWGFTKGGLGSKVHPSYTASGLTCSISLANKPIRLSIVY